MSALAQPGSSSIPTVLPSPTEHTAAPGAIFSEVVHTGTDGIKYDVQFINPGDPQQGQTMQVMTWDEGDNVYVSWGFYDNDPAATRNGALPNVLVSRPAEQGSFDFSVTSSEGGADPDIVLAYDPASKQLYANLVYIDGGRTKYEAMRWDYGPARTFVRRTPVLMGDARFTHSYPNIDANTYGLVAVTWQQTVTDKVVVSVVSTSNYFPSYTTDPPIKVTFGRSVLAAGDITGNFRPCYKDTFSSTYGVYVLNPPNGLLEQTLHPDVAISNAPESEAIISSVFVRHYVDGTGLFTILNKVDVVQTQYDRCGIVSEPNPDIVGLAVTDRYEWDYSENNVIGSPRIAASAMMPGSGRDADVEVAIDRTVDNCGPVQYAIWNFGKNNGTFRPDYTLVSPAGPGIRLSTLLYSVEPAIAYTLTEDRRLPGFPYNTYAISWTGAEYDSQNEGSQQDVWSVLLVDGTFGNSTRGPLAQAPLYSRVNWQGQGNQRSASIAGRFFRASNPYLRGVGSGTGTASKEPESAPSVNAPFIHLFFDQYAKRLGFRRSQNAPGYGALRPAAPALPPLQAYPNPSGGAVTLRLALRPGETVQSLRVADALGRPVADLPAPKPGADTVEWRPAVELPAGVYSVRAVTDERTVSVSVTRN